MALTRNRTRLLIACAVIFAIVGPHPAGALGPTVQLGTARSYAVLAGTTVTNTGPSTINGDVGLSPGSAVVGFPPGTVNNGVIHAADAGALQAQADVVTAYNDAAGRATTGAVSADLAGQTLVSGVYTGGALALTGALTLDAQGDPNAVFVFQAASTLITASASSVILINGAAPCNVFWQVGSSATLGTNSMFVGTVLALTSVTAGTGATVQGRLLARNGAVTLDNNNVTPANCAGSAAATTTTTSAQTTTPPSSTTPTAATTIPGATPTTVRPGRNLPDTGPRHGGVTAGIAGLILAAGTGMVLAVRRSPRNASS